MTQTIESARALLCPSVTTIGPESRVFGVLTRSVTEELQVAYLSETLPATAELLAVAAPAEPTEVFRAAAPCAQGACQHFDGARCRLAAKITAMLDPVVSGLPHCAIRRTCLWFRQEGREACLRCPQVATEQRNSSELQRAVAGRG